MLSVGDGIFLLALAVIWLFYSVKIARLAEKQGNDSLTREHLAELPWKGPTRRPAVAGRRADHHANGHADGGR